MKCRVPAYLLMSMLLCSCRFVGKEARVLQPEGKENELLRMELEQMLVSDQKHRREIMRVMQDSGRDSAQLKDLVKKMRATDKHNITRLVSIIEEHGWPGRSLVGEKASTGAFMVLQHAGLVHQKQYLPLLREAAERGECRGQSLALLEDRILMKQGKKQVYGSQLTRGSQGKLEVWPIEDEANVDKSRARVGLEPLAAYLKRFGLDYRPKMDAVTNEN